MTFTYQPATPTRREEIRFLSGDTNTADQLLSDEELYMVGGFTAATATAGLDVAAYHTAADVVRHLASRFSRFADMAEGDQKIDAGQKAVAFAARVTELRAEAVRIAHTASGALLYAGGLSRAEKEDVAADTDAIPPFFTRDSPDDPTPAGITAWGES